MTQEPTHRVDEDGTQRWYVNDQLHRLDGPAYIGAAGTQQWWVAGQLHRLDGPAYIGAAGTQEWYVRDQNITTQVNSWMQTQAVTWPWDDQTQMQFLLNWG
jgi:hypothetical protein